MPAELIRRAAALALATGAAVPAMAVGLGPLVIEGTVAGPRKAFYLTILNPYPDATTFVLSARGRDDEGDPGDVRIHPARLTLAAGSDRRVIVVADNLEPGPTRWFRVCAERAVDPEGSPIHARVCSRLGARRVVPAAAVR